MSETIRAIAGLWPLALIVFAFSATLIFRRQIAAVLERLSKFSMKRGQTEVVIEGVSAQAGAVNEAARPPAASEPPVPEEPSKDLPASSQSSSETGGFGGMLDAIFEHRFDDAQAAFEAMQAVDQDATSKIETEILYVAVTYAYGKPDSSLQRLEAIASAHADSRAKALGWLSWAYSKVGALEQAREARTRAVAAARNDDERAEHLVGLVKIYRGIGNLDEARELIVSALGLALSKEAELRVYREAANVFKDSDEKLLHAVTLEKAVALNPVDLDLRFSAAYAESEAGLNHSASANYERLIEQDTKSAALARNNLGALADGFKLPLKSVALYRAAANDGETLSNANLANKLLNQGFLDEARGLLNAAVEQNDVHANVNEALADIPKREAAEEDSWNSILKHGAAQRLFLHKFADARFRPYQGSSPFDGEWIDVGGDVIRIEEKGAQISAAWGQGGTTLLGKNTKRKFKGARVNRSVIGVIKKWKVHTPFDTDGSFEFGGSTALAYVAGDGKRIEILALEQDSPSLYVLNRGTGSGSALGGAD